MSENRSPDQAQDALQRMVQALRALPGVGPKSAQRMAFHLLQHDRNGAAVLGQSLLDAVNHIQHCSSCNTFSELNICTTLTYKGLYFVLMGRLSPLDGLGPNEIHLDRLIERVEKSPIPVKEVVLATNFTSEGEATAHYIGEIMKVRDIKVSRIARGVPVGGELEYVDASTLARAMMDRRSVS